MLKLIIPLYLFIEIILILAFINNYNFYWYISEVLISAFFGFYIIKKFGFLNIMDLQNILRNTSKSIGGLLLVLPFCISDIFGIIILLFAFLNKKEKQEEKNQNEDIIDVEIIEEVTNENQNSK